MPEGSSSLAPVMSPGPSTFQKRESLDEVCFLLVMLLVAVESPAKVQPYLVKKVANIEIANNGMT